MYFPYQILELELESLYKYEKEQNLRKKTTQKNSLPRNSNPDDHHRKWSHVQEQKVIR